MPPRLVLLVACQIKTCPLVEHTLRSTSLVAPRDNLDDVLQILRNVRTAQLPAPQRLSQASDLFGTVSLCGLPLSPFHFTRLCDGRLFLAQSVQTLSTAESLV